MAVMQIGDMWVYMRSLANRNALFLFVAVEPASRLVAVLGARNTEI